MKNIFLLLLTISTMTACGQSTTTKKSVQPKFIPSGWETMTFNDIDFTTIDGYDDVYQFGWAFNYYNYGILPYFLQVDLNGDESDDVVWILKNKLQNKVGVFAFLKESGTYKECFRYVLNYKDSGYTSDMFNLNNFNDLMIFITPAGYQEEYVGDKTASGYEKVYYKYPQLNIGPFESHATFYMYNKSTGKLEER